MTSLSLAFVVSSRTTLAISHLGSVETLSLAGFVTGATYTEESARFSEHTIAHTERGSPTFLPGMKGRGRHNGQSIIKRVEYLSKPVMPHRSNQIA